MTTNDDNVLDLNKYRCDKHLKESGSCVDCDFFVEDGEGIYCELGGILEWFEDYEIVDG